ncbi:MAG: tetratricopeptide repeat protein [Blastocatellia bacterium]|nr:tetratricopeptide repeat protein [Blastocatellia bacterium]
MKKAIPISIIVVGLGVLYPLQRWIDATMPREVISDETLYFASGEQIKRMSLGLDGLVADIYWIRTVQYFGRKVGVAVRAGMNTSEIRMDLLAPLLDIIVTLDPHHISAYRFGAIFLPERDLPAAINLLERGIRENPDKWRLYQDIGFIHWQSGDYAEAAEWYERGSKVEGAMWWMRDLAGLMKIKGESREAARIIYEGYATSEDENIRDQAVKRLKQLHSLDERDAINSLLDYYKNQTGACPKSFRPLAPALKSMGLELNEESSPVDPDGFPYQLNQETCQAELVHESTIMR